MTSRGHERSFRFMRTQLRLTAILAIVVGACSQAPELAADVIQDKEPIDRISMYFTGFHPMKEHPHHAMEAHHFCSKLSEDFSQCVLFDSADKDAKMNGIEYIISEKVFEALPAEERKYWHPHNFEIMSGQLTLPGVPDFAEHEAMKTLVNGYGKTWHLWETGGPGMQAEPLPYGEPILAWSYNADGEIPKELVVARDRRLGISIEAKKKNREDLAPLLHCQEGVNALAEAFPNRQPIPGICEKKD